MMDFRTVLGEELARRKRRNPRYSLRAFALALGTHHTTLSRILAGRRRLTRRTIHGVGARLQLTGGQLSEACIVENCHVILRLVRQRRFRPDARWIAVTVGIPLDATALALHRLLHDGRLVVASPTRWMTGEP